MIENQNDVTKYTPSGKMYLPSNLINSSYYYRMQTNYILIITNQNCTGSGTNKNCNCVAYYFDTDTLGQTYSCNAYITAAANYIPYTAFTSDINYNVHSRTNFFQDKFIMFGMLIIALLFFISLRKGYRYK